MTVDKRTVHTDALETLGMLITDKEKRDAIHLAVEPVICGDPFLNAGEDVGFYPDGTVGNDNIELEDYVGIVDPFLKDDIHKGDRFWLVVYPRKITSLRHVWEHPGFPKSLEIQGELTNDEEKLMSEIWIRQYAKSLGLSYHTLMWGADDYLEHTEYICEGPLLDGITTNEEFWDHYQIVTGKTVSKEEQGNFFACSC